MKWCKAGVFKLACKRVTVGLWKSEKWLKKIVNNNIKIIK